MINVDGDTVNFNGSVQFAGSVGPNIVNYNLVCAYNNGLISGQADPNGKFTLSLQNADGSVTSGNLNLSAATGLVTNANGEDTNGIVANTTGTASTGATIRVADAGRRFRCIRHVSFLGRSSSLTRPTSSSRRPLTVGLDQAKNVFHVHAVDLQGHIVVRKQLRRSDGTSVFRNA